MTEIAQLISSDARRSLRKSVGLDRPNVSRKGYEARLDAIVKYCEQVRTTPEITREFGYNSPTSVFHVLTVLVREGRLMKEGRGKYVSVRRRILDTSEQLQRGLTPFEARYLEQLEADARNYCWEASFELINPQLVIKDFLKWCKDKQEPR